MQRIAATASLAALAFCLGSHAQAKDPMAIFYNDTQVCAGGINGDDACHLWVYGDGTFVMFGGMQGGHFGHYKIGPARPDGKIPICYYLDTLGIDIPPALAATQAGPAGPPGGGAPGAGGPPPGAGPGGPGGGMPRGPMGCDTVNFHTTCGPGHGKPAVDAQGKPLPLAKGIIARFHNGMCYPMQVDHKVGDHWIEKDDPSPSQGGLDQLFLLPGHR